MYGHACNWSRQLRVGVKKWNAMYIAIDDTRRLEGNGIYLFSKFFYDLSFFLSLSLLILVSLFLSRILLFSMVFRDRVEYSVTSRDRKSLVHFVWNWRAGLSKVERMEEGPTSFPSFWIVACSSIKPRKLSSRKPRSPNSSNFGNCYSIIDEMKIDIVIYSKEFSFVWTESFCTRSG